MSDSLCVHVLDSHFLCGRNVKAHKAPVKDLSVTDDVVISCGGLGDPSIKVWKGNKCTHTMKNGGFPITVLNGSEHMRLLVDAPTSSKPDLCCNALP